MKNYTSILIGLVALGVAGCVNDVDIGSASEPLTACGPMDNEIRDGAGATIGTLDVTNDEDSLQVQIDVPSGFTGVKIYLGPPPPPVPFADGDLALSTIEESFASTTSRSYDVPFSEIGVPCGDEVKIVVKIFLADGSIAWAWAANPDYVYHGTIPYDYYRACEASCQGQEEPPPPPSGCTLTQGYWKNHLDAWPTSSLMLGGVSYDTAALVALFKTSPKGDESVILAHQLIAAKLNMLAGASDPATATVVAAADAWLAANADADGMLPFGQGSGASRGEAITLAQQLDSFNRGVTGPGHCDD